MDKSESRYHEYSTTVYDAGKLRRLSSQPGSEARTSATQLLPTVGVI